MEYRLGDCIEKIIDNRGKNPKYYAKEKYPVIDNVLIKNTLYPNMKDVNRYINQETYDNFLRDYLEKDLPIMTLVGSGIGNVSLSPSKNVAIVQNTIGFKTKYTLLNSVYLYYWFLIKHQELVKFNRGSGQPSIKKTDIEGMKINLPNIEIQDKIVKILFTIDKKIELNNQINDNLYELANQLYQKAFSKDKSIKWKKYNLTDIANINTGYSYKSSELVENSTTGMATIKNFERTGGFKVDGFKPLNPSKKKSSQYVNKFDVLVACTDLTQNADIIGNAVLLLSKGNYENIVISMDLVKVTSKVNYIDNFMIYAILNSKEFKNYAIGYTSGTTVLHLNKNCFKEFTIKLPEKNIIQNFIKEIKPIYLKISQTMEENRKLEQLRDTLLPKLMNGEIDLDKIEI